MNIDDFDELIASIDDVASSAIGLPMNDTVDAIHAMLTEHVIDYETACKWLLGCLTLALDHVGRLNIDVEDALSSLRDLSPCELAIVGFNDINVMLGETKKGGRRRGSRSQG